MSKNSSSKPEKSIVKGPLGAIVLAVVVGAVLAGAFLIPTGSEPLSSSAPSNSSAASVSVSAEVGPNIARIAAEAKGFSVGPQLRAHTTYVFFDAQCIHCAVLWNAMKPLESQTRAVWIPVGILSRASVNQGAAILSAANSVDAMNLHEELMSAKKGGISAIGGASAEMTKTISANTKLMGEMGGKSIPYVVARHAITGELVTSSGSAPTATMANTLGLTLK